MDMGRGCRTPSEQSWWGNRLSEARLSWAVASLIGAWGYARPLCPNTAWAGPVARPLRLISFGRSERGPSRAGSGSWVWAAARWEGKAGMPIWALGYVPASSLTISIHPQMPQAWLPGSQPWSPRLLWISGFSPEVRSRILGLSQQLVRSGLAGALGWRVQ